jgi:heptosyltransferase-2
MPVTLLAKPRSAADRLLAGEAALCAILWLDRNPDAGKGEHDGVGLLRMARLLRDRRFDSLYLLHHSRSLAALSWLAGIPARYGYGFGVQRLFLNHGPFLPASALPLHPYEQATQWLALAGIPLTEAEPRLSADPSALARVRKVVPGPFVALGIGSSEPYKQWGAGRFAELAAMLVDAGWPAVALVGGQAEIALAAEIERRSGRAGRILCAVGWDLTEVIALLADAAFYVGNDTGVLNIAAAVGTRCHGLFGATPPLRHTDRVVAITPRGGIDRVSGMSGISVAVVLESIHADRGRLGPAV